MIIDTGCSITGVFCYNSCKRVHVKNSMGMKKRKMKQSKTYEQVVDEILAKGKFGEAPGAYDIRKWMEILGPVD